MSVNLFDYVSAMISYSLVGIAVFSGKYDSLEPSQLSSVISKVVCLPVCPLVSGFLLEIYFRITRV